MTPSKPKGLMGMPRLCWPVEAGLGWTDDLQRDLTLTPE